MTEKFISEDDFYATYKPLTNPFNANVSWNGCMLETYGREHEHVLEMLKKEPRKVWTVLECDGSLIVTSGYHHVNRMGYILTEVPVADDEWVSTIDEDPLGDDDENEDEDEDEEGGE